MSSYIQDLDRLVCLKLDSEAIYDLLFTSVYWSQIIDNVFWKLKTTSALGFPLPYGIDCEIMYFTFIHIYLRVIIDIAILKQYNDIAVFLIKRFKRQLDLRTVLENAVKCNNEPMVSFLIDHMLTLDNINSILVTMAARRGFLDMIKLLLSKGVKIDTYSLAKAVENENIEVVKYLLHHGADPKQGIQKVLSLASRLSNLEVMELLLANGADIHAKDDEALYIATIFGKVKAVRFLLNRGANAHARNDMIITASVNKGFRHITKLLLSRDADK